MSTEATTQQFTVEDPIKAITILINAAKRAQGMGAYSIQESKMIYDAIVFFRPEESIEYQNTQQQEQQAPETPEPVETQESTESAQ